MATTYADAGREDRPRHRRARPGPLDGLHRLPVRPVVLAVLRRASYWSLSSSRRPSRAPRASTRSCSPTTAPPSIPETTGFRAGILGSVWVMLATAALSVPLGIAAALHLEEFADRDRWWNRLIEINLQNLAAVPSVVYGLLGRRVRRRHRHQTSAASSSRGAHRAVAPDPARSSSSRRARRSVPCPARSATAPWRWAPLKWQTTWRQRYPSAIPGIATGTILASRVPSAKRPLLMIGTATAVRFDPNGLMSQFTALPLQIFSTRPRSPAKSFRVAAWAAIIVLLVMILGLNALAIFIRNKFHRTW